MLSIIGALAFLLAALASSALPASVRHGMWLPIHLAFAGGATTAIAGVMPFFSAAFAAAPPMDMRLRLAAVAAVSAGALGVSIAVVLGYPIGAAGSGVLYVAGICLVAVATIRPFGRGLGPTRGLVTQGYVSALLAIVLGATLAVLNLAGVELVVELWPLVRVGHAWLNLFGFVSLVIATTMLHFFPTVVGARIAARPTARLVVLGLGVGPLLVASGVILRIDLVAWAGAVLVATGAVGLTAYCVLTWRTRARWTTDAGWHAFSMAGLASAVFWFDVSVAIAAGRVVEFGASPDAWSASAVIAPLMIGWLGFAILASANHLIPSVGPGDPIAHSRQRRALGRLAIARIVAINGGTGALAIGLPLAVDGLVTAGLVLISSGLLVTAALVGHAVVVGMKSVRARPVC